MRIFISVDMEGISGIERVEEIFRGMPAYHIGRQIMAGDVNAAVQGAVDGGATNIVVADSHGYMCNIRPRDLHHKAKLKSGMKRVLCQFKGFSHRFDAAFFVGYHSKAGTADGILSHTWIPAFKDVRVNGLSVGEYGLNGYLVGSFGVPSFCSPATIRRWSRRSLCSETSSTWRSRNPSAISRAIIYRSKKVTPAFMKPPRERSNASRPNARRLVRRRPGSSCPSRSNSIWLRTRTI